MGTCPTTKLHGTCGNGTCPLSATLFLVPYASPVTVHCGVRPTTSVCFCPLGGSDCVRACRRVLRPALRGAHAASIVAMSCSREPGHTCASFRWRARRRPGLARPRRLFALHVQTCK